MKRSALMVVAAITAAVPASAADRSDDAAFTVSCANAMRWKGDMEGGPLPLKVLAHGVDASGKRHAIVSGVQINISQGTSAGVLRLDENNPVACKVTVNEPYKMTGATFSFVPGQTYDNTAPSDTKLIEGQVVQRNGSPVITDGGRTMVVTIVGTGPLVGNVQIVLDITYHAAGGAKLGK